MDILPDVAKCYAQSVQQSIDITAAVRANGNWSKGASYKITKLGSGFMTSSDNY